jgi:hypothetical protein
LSGYISEFFGYFAGDKSQASLNASTECICPFLDEICKKHSNRRRVPSGVCAIRQVSKGSPNVICCPNQLYSENYKILNLIAQDNFASNLILYPHSEAVKHAKLESGAIAVFGRKWGNELGIPQRDGKGFYYVDWVLARLNAMGELQEFTAIEIQTIDTTGNYWKAYDSLVNSRAIVKDTVGLNWENVSKRIIPQIIYKGQILQREELCKSGLYFVSPKPVYDHVLTRLGGKEKLPEMHKQPASIHFLAFDYSLDIIHSDGYIHSLDVIAQHSIAVYKVQEAFSSVSLPDRNVFRDEKKLKLLQKNLCDFYQIIILSRFKYKKYIGLA